MRCWHCKSDMPDGLKYCGKCGVHMNRTIHFFHWLFSKKGLPVLLLILALIAGGILWAVLANLDTPDVEIDLPGLTEPVDSDNPSGDPVQTYDYGIYPYATSFIAGDIKDGGPSQNQDLYTLLESSTVNFTIQYNESRQAHDYIVTGSNPHYVNRYQFVPELEDQVNAYLELLEEETFSLELVHEIVEEENHKHIRFYRYTGVQEVFPLEPSDWVEEDLGEYHLQVTLDIDAGAVNLSVYSGLGLEGIYREDYEAILAGETYHRSIDDNIVMEDGG